MDMSLSKLSSVQFSRSVMSDSSRPHESQHARPPCPLPTPGVYSNSCPSSRWCHPAISSPVVPFSSRPQSLPASGSFTVNQHFTWGGQSIGVSASASVLSMNTQDWSPSGWTGWISLQSKGLLRVFANTTVQKHQFFGAQLSSQSQLSHPYMTTGKNIPLTRQTFGGKVMSVLFKMLRRQWRTGKAGMLQFTGSQRVRHNLATEQQQSSYKILALFPVLCNIYS